MIEVINSYKVRNDLLQFWFENIQAAKIGKNQAFPKSNFNNFL